MQVIKIYGKCCFSDSSNAQCFCRNGEVATPEEGHRPDNIDMPVSDNNYHAEDAPSPLQSKLCKNCHHAITFHDLMALVDKVRRR